VAAPQYGSAIFQGASGKTYSVDMYLSDVNAGSVNWDGGAGAGASSPTYWKAPEDVTLVDYAQVTGMTDTEKIRLTVNARPTMHVLRYVIHVSTIATRPALRIGFKANAEIAGIQISD